MTAFSKPYTPSIHIIYAHSTPAPAYCTRRKYWVISFDAIFARSGTDHAFLSFLFPFGFLDTHRGIIVSFPGFVPLLLDLDLRFNGIWDFAMTIVFRFRVPGFRAYSLITHRQPETPGAKGWQECFKTQGYYTWNVTVARKQIAARIYPHDVEKFCSWDTSFIWDQFPKETDILTLHGLVDTTVPP